MCACVCVYVCVCVCVYVCVCACGSAYLLYITHLSFLCLLLHYSLVQPVLHLLYHLSLVFIYVVCMKLIEIYKLIKTTAQSICAAHTNCGA